MPPSRLEAILSILGRQPGTGVPTLAPSVAGPGSRAGAVNAIINRTFPGPAPAPVPVAPAASAAAPVRASIINQLMNLPVRGLTHPESFGEGGSGVGPDGSAGPGVSGANAGSGVGDGVSAGAAASAAAANSTAGEMGGPVSMDDIGDPVAEAAVQAAGVPPTGIPGLLSQALSRGYLGFRGITQPRINLNPNLLFGLTKEPVVDDVRDKLTVPPIARNTVTVDAPSTQTQTQIDEANLAAALDAFSGQPSATSAGTGTATDPGPGGTGMGASPTGTGTATAAQAAGPTAGGSAGGASIAGGHGVDPAPSAAAAIAGFNPTTQGLGPDAVSVDGTGGVAAAGDVGNPGGIGEAPGGVGVYAEGAFPVVGPNPMVSGEAVPAVVHENEIILPPDMSQALMQRLGTTTPEDTKAAMESLLGLEPENLIGGPGGDVFEQIKQQVQSANPSSEVAQSAMPGEDTGSTPQIIGKTQEGRLIIQYPGGPPRSEYTIGVSDPRLNDGQETDIPSIFRGVPTDRAAALERVLTAGGRDPDTGRVIDPRTPGSAQARSQGRRSFPLDAPLRQDLVMQSLMRALRR